MRRPAKGVAFIARAAVAANLLFSSIEFASATFRIYDDPGGQIGEYLAKYRALRASGERIVIDGTCASACTMILGIVPHNRICITPNAVLEFHAAWDVTPTGRKVVSRAGNAILLSNYPRDVRNWISEHGGLTTQMLDLGGPELAAMFSSCR
jgi:hypothetical protein